MKQKSYLVQLSRAACWWLPPEEAEEVTADYRDMLAQDPRSYEELRRDFGPPYQAVLRVCSVRPCLRWLAVFCILAACLLFPVVWMYRGYEIYSGVFGWGNMVFGVLLLGAVLSMIWFQRGGVRAGKLPRTLFVLLALLFALGVGVGVLAWSIFSLRILELPYWSVGVGTTITVGLRLISILAALAGLLGLVQARVEDRRWRAVFVLGLTVLLLIFTLHRAMTWMLPFNDDWWAPYVWRMVPLTVMGLVGTGISLC